MSVPFAPVSTIEAVFWVLVLVGFPRLMIDDKPSVLCPGLVLFLIQNRKYHGLYALGLIAGLIHDGDNVKFSSLIDRKGR